MRALRTFAAALLFTLIAAALPDHAHDPYDPAADYSLVDHVTVLPFEVNAL